MIVTRIGVEDLIRFYQQHYRPNGAVLVVVGDLDPERALDRIAGAFERIPSGAGQTLRTSIVEPRQSGRRDFTIGETDGVARGLFGWRTVARGHVDVAGARRPGRSALLRATVAALAVAGGRRTDAATWVEASHAAAQRAGQLFIQLEADAGIDPIEIEKLIRDGVAPPCRARAHARGAVAVAPPPRSGLAMGTGRPGWSRCWSGQRRALGRLAELAGRTSRGDGRRRRRGASGRRHLPQ